MKKLIFYFVPFFSFSLSCFAGGGDTLHTTVMLDELNVIASRSMFYSSDRRLTRFDSATLKQNSFNNLGELLAASSLLNITQYGSSGSLAQVSFRGTQATQTSVNWNGMPLNSITVGSMDLSLIPVEGFKEVTVQHGAPAAIYGSGTFGGAIDLTSTADWDKHFSLSFSNQSGSFGDQKNSLHLLSGNDRVQYQASGFIQHAENNFTYQYGGKKFTQQHNHIFNYGLLQNFYLRLPANNNVEAGLWLQSKAMELPPLMGSQTVSAQNQDDNTFKAFIRWNKLFGKVLLRMSSSYANDYMHYSDSLQNIDSKISQQRSFNDACLRIYLNSFFTIDAGSWYNYVQAKTGYYESIISENWWAVYSSIRYKNKNLITNLSLSKEFYGKISVTPLVAIGANYAMLNNRLGIKANISNKFRVPSFNDKYWQPYGNPDLKPESGYSGDAGVYANINTTSYNADVECTAFASLIDNLIVWVPVTSSLSKPKSNKQVFARGIEFSTTHKLNSGKLSNKIQLQYTYTRSTNRKVYDDNSNIIGNQLMYIPIHTCKASWQSSYAGAFARINWVMASKRFTDENENTFLEAYQVYNLQIGKQFNYRNLQADLQFKVNNLFNKSYNLIAAYPMPGRAFYISLTLNMGSQRKTNDLAKY